MPWIWVSNLFKSQKIIQNIFLPRTDANEEFYNILFFLKIFWIFILAYRNDIINETNWRKSVLDLIFVHHNKLNF